jgi:hypothetical protein
MARVIWAQMRSRDPEDWDVLPENKKIFSRLFAKAAAGAVAEFHEKEGR